jgi:hypothetical protein
MFSSDFCETTYKFLTGKRVLGTQLFLQNHRYQYRDDDGTHIVCGIAREAMAAAVRTGIPHLGMEDSWRDAFFQQRNNPSVLSFLVKQRLISTIASDGLELMDEVTIPSTPISSFLDDTVPLTKTCFLVPTKPNCLAVDCVYVNLDIEKCIATIIPVQITIAKNHSDSEAKFFQTWDKWTLGLESAFTIRVVFLWIKEAGQTIEQVPRKGGRCLLHLNLRGSVCLYPE